jgi:uncharacterized membrane protein
MTSDTTRTARLQLAGMLLIALATGVAFAIGTSLGEGLVTGGIVATFALLVHLGRGRSSTIEAIGGIGDERTASLYLRASSFAGGVMSVVLPGWWLVTVVQGDPDSRLSALCAVFAVSFLGASVWLARRG